ncbi:hypothetical protein GF359_10175 [candidate division WOR-3 bacterium]|uniref:Uncharacterized protein n=1 Tax=candidate division WOR-3 bacterium TaxID=2052148 RepID=A0A9D5KAT3_UNCW3|nr:hypothetical protein [candidate division WOR-3 bacterium]MBD3365566.1 hypothetical protein [candidate division WOR-3 bacterium]
MNKLLFAVLFVSTLGCLDYTSVTTIKPDGSGSLSFELNIPVKEGNKITFEGFETRLDTTSGWKTKSFLVDTLDSTQRLRVNGEFSSIVDIGSPMGNREFMGFSPDSFAFSRQEIESGYRYHYYRSFGFDKNRDVQVSISLPDAGGFVWREELILPGQIVSHNADEERDGKLIWERSTSEVLEKGLVIDVIWEVPG